MPKLTVEEANKKWQQSYYMAAGVLLIFAVVTLIAKSHFGTIPIWFLVPTIILTFAAIYWIMQRNLQIGVDVLHR